MDTQLHLLNTAAAQASVQAAVDTDSKPARFGPTRTRQARLQRVTRDGSPATWRLSAETRAAGRRGVAQARAALQSAHRAGPDHRAA